MPTFRLTVRPLGDSFHGRGDGGEPEWPPSPLRAFQALVAAAAGRWKTAQFEGYAGPALRWLEGLDAPEIIVPPGRTATRPYRLYVPNNAGDLVAAAWARGNPDASIAEHRTEKDVRPTRFAEDRAICFDWPLTPDQHAAGVPLVPLLAEAARSITHLGWGVDQAVGHAAVLVGERPHEPDAERWVPSGEAVSLRVPTAGTLKNLVEKHERFLGRLTGGEFNPVPPLTAFTVVGYRNAAVAPDPAGRLWAAFELLNPDTDEGGRVSFDPARHTRCVAAWVRHAVAGACAGWPADYGTVERFVHGHDGPDRPAKGDGADRRFQYLPLPTINSALGRVESIRRVLVAAPPGCERQIDWVRQRLGGRPLEWDGRVVGLLNTLPDGDWVRRQYTRPGRDWSTVTPVLLPGFDDRDRSKCERLLWRAFEQAGLSTEALAGATADWRPVGYRAGLDPAWQYQPAAEAEHWPRYHVRVRFARLVAGPLAVGAGRYRGFGLFAAD